MSLSFEEKARLGAMYERYRWWQKFGAAAGFTGFFMPLVTIGHEWMRELHVPDAGKHIVGFCGIAFCAGAVLAAELVLAVLLSRLRKRDAETIAFMEKHFPDDCPWKEEEKILRQAEELDREAKAGNIVAGAIQRREA